MYKYKDIEMLAKELEIPNLKNVSSKGFTTEDIVAMKYKDLEPFGLTPEEFGKLKKYLNQISNENPAPDYEEIQIDNQTRVTNYPVQNQMSQPKQMAQPNKRIIGTQEIAEKLWSNHLFDCCHDLPFCITASAMPCVAFGLIYSEGQPEPTGLGCLSMGLGFCASMFVSALFPITCLLGASQRKGIREKYNISGDGCEDIFLHCCCQPCAMTQEMLELRHQKESQY